MSSLSPIKRKSQTASEIDLSQYDSIPEYHPIERVVKPRIGRLRDRVGVKELAQIVGSRNYRNIKRSSNFMPGQFQLWNAKENGGNGKYWGGYQDVDGDEIPHEFVVRRGDEKGPMVAVNGYTTKRSDWIARKAFYENYPDREQRKGKSAKKFMREEYYKPKYDEYGHVTEWGVEPGTEADIYATKEYKRYNTYIPKDLSPYQLIQKYIFKPAFAAYLQESKMTRKGFVKEFGFGSIATSTSNVYYALVKEVIYAKLANTEQYKNVIAEFEQDYIRIRQRKDPGYDQSADDFTEDFINYLFTRKDIKVMATEYVHHIVSNPEAKIAAAKVVIAEGVAAARAARADDSEIL